MDSRERFTATVSDYKAARPTYTDELLRWLWADAGLQMNDEIVDIGCGTGISTRWLAQSGISVIGIEPNAKMLQAAREAGDESRRITWVNSDAESFDLGGRKVKAIVGGQSFHWLDLKKANINFRKYLNPNGRVIAFWNVRDLSVPYMKAFHDLLLRECPVYPEHEEKLALLNFGLTDYLQDSGRPQGLQDLHVARLGGVEQILDFETFSKRTWSSSYVKHSVRNIERFNNSLVNYFNEHNEDGVIHFKHKSVVFSYLP